MANEIRSDASVLAVIAKAMSGKRIDTLTRSERTTIQMLTLHGYMEVDGNTVQMTEKSMNNLNT